MKQEYEIYKVRTKWAYVAYYGGIKFICFNLYLQERTAKKAAKKFFENTAKGISYQIGLAPQGWRIFLNGAGSLKAFESRKKAELWLRQWLS